MLKRAVQRVFPLHLAPIDDFFCLDDRPEGGRVAAGPQSDRHQAGVSQGFLEERHEGVRIDLAHLCWSLENLAAGTPANIIEVDEETTHWSLVSLERMLQVK